MKWGKIIEENTEWSIMAFSMDITECDWILEGQYKLSRGVTETLVTCTVINAGPARNLGERDAVKFDPIIIAAFKNLLLLAVDDYKEKVKC